MRLLVGHRETNGSLGKISKQRRWKWKLYPISAALVVRFFIFLQAKGEDRWASKNHLEVCREISQRLSIVLLRLWKNGSMPITVLILLDLLPSHGEIGWNKTPNRSSSLDTGYEWQALRSPLALTLIWVLFKNHSEVENMWKICTPGNSFWDGENVSLSNVAGDLQQGSKQVTN